MFRSLVLAPFALVLGLALARADAHAAEGSVCPVQCGSCDDGTCRIECAPGSSCEQETVTCPSGMHCEVACVGDASCRAATIVGPSDHDLAIECNGDSACGDATLQCGTGMCDWACTTTGACENIAVR
ncbi:MAG TPA: hypothetical protein VG755_25410 [Nannocystaceae bacterium]|nr:hypothetical protein [Nannocystaceae bacterium]